MAEELKPVIRIDVGDSQRTVKGLKDEIKILRDTILNLEKGTDEYNQAVEKLTQDQRELDEVMALTKKTATALDGSYDALVQRMSLLKKEWRATADAAKRAEIGKEIGEINAQLKELDAEIGNYQRNVGNYVSHWEGMPDVTRDFGTALKENNQQIEPAKQGLEGLGNIASGLASGFAAVKGAMAMLGVENENLEKTFVSLQAAMALAQGLSGMKGLVEGASKLSAVLGVSVKTLGLWGLAIAGVTTALYYLFSNLESVKKQELAWQLQKENSIKAQENFKKSIEKTNEALEKQIDLMKAQGVAEKETLQLQIDNAKNAKSAAWKNLMQAQNKYFDVRSDAQGVMEMTNGAFKQKYGMSKDEALEHYKGLMDSAGDFYDEQEKLYNDYLHQMEVLEAREKKQFEDRLKNMEESLKSEEEKLKAQYEKDLKQAEEYGLDTSVITAKYQADLKALKARYDAAKSTITNSPKDDPNKILRQEYKERISLETQAAERKLSSLEVQKQKEIENAYATINNEKELAAKLEEIERDYAGKEYEIELQLKEKKLALLREWQGKNTDTKMEEVEISQAIADEEVAIELYKQQRLTEIAEQGNRDRNKPAETVAQVADEAKKEIETFKELWDSLDTKGKIKEAIDVTASGLQAAGNVMQGIMEIYQAKAEEDEKITEEEAKRLKNLQYATATINMLQGAISAYSAAQSIPPPIGPIVGAVNAAAVIAMGTANLMKIKNTDLTGSVSSGAQAAVTPNSNVFGTEVPISYVKNVTTASEIDALNNQDNRVYILESDIQESNKKVQVRESESSF